MSSEAEAWNAKLMMTSFTLNASYVIGRDHGPCLPDVVKLDNHHGHLVQARNHQVGDDDLCNKISQVDISDLVITEMQSDLTMKLQISDYDVTKAVKLSIKKSGHKNDKTSTTEKTTFPNS